MMNDPWWRLKSFSALLAVLVLGMLIGSLLTWHLSKVTRDFDRRDPNAAVNFIIGNLNSELSLSSPQQKAISTILQLRIKEMRAIHKLIEPQQADLRLQTQQQIRSQLDPNQQGKFDALLNGYSRELLFICGPPPLNPIPTP